MRLANMTTAVDTHVCGEPGRVWDRSSTWTGAIDRSRCGTGTCARMAALHARSKLGLNADFVHEGILGTVFAGRLLEETTVGPHRTVVPTITGRAWITGFAQYVLEADDPSPLHPPRRTCQSSVVSATSLWES